MKSKSLLRISNAKSNHVPRTRIRGKEYVDGDTQTQLPRKLEERRRKKDTECVIEVMEVGYMTEKKKKPPKKKPAEEEY